MKNLNLAVLISGDGNTLQNLLELSENGKLNARIALVVSSNSRAFGIVRANGFGIHVRVCERRHFKSDRLFSDGVTEYIDEVNPDLIVLAGFKCLYLFPKKYAGKVINIHPALLPKFGGKGFYGLNVHSAVIDAKERESGCTVHFADLEYDNGPIILQRKVAVNSYDTPKTLQQKVLIEENIAYSEAINLFSHGKIVLSDNKVTILP